MEALLKKILQATHIGESTDCEFKAANGGFPGSFWATYSAMANTEGGTVVLGVKEKKDGCFHIDGLSTQQINTYKKVLWDSLNNRGKVSKNLLSLDDVDVVVIADKIILAIHIPRASHTDRPIYIGPTPFGHTYRRRHEGDYLCTDEEVRRMLADADPIPSDHRILESFTFEDLDQESIVQYQRRLAVSRPNHPWLNLNQHELLEKLGGWRKDKTSKQEGVTMAGLLMLGRYESITDAHAAPHYFVDYREKLDPDVSWSNRICPDGTWEANLFQFYQRIWPHLIADLKVPFRLEGLQRQDETSAHKALREAFVNALIHTDYREAGGIVIERYLDRFVLENPGTLLVSMEQLLRGGVSKCRNPSLQKMFLMIGGGEKAGSGFDRIQSGWRNQHWRPPSLIVQDHPDRVRLVLPMMSLIPNEALTALQQRFDDRLRYLKEPEVQALVTAYLEDGVSNVRLQEVLSDHPADITQILQSLCSKGMLISNNRRRWAHYRLPPLGAKEFIPNSSHLAQDSSHLAQDSSHLAQDSSHLAQDSSHLAQDSSHFQTIKKKIPHDEMLRTIYQLCSGRFLTASELSNLLRRKNAANIRHRFLSPMVAKGILRLRYPESPNRPDQAYTAEESYKP